MKSNILAFFFTIGSIVMAVFIVWFYNMSDRAEPEMRFTSYDLTYNADTKEQDLLNGVMAYDAVDGDITDRIVVEKTIFNEEQSTAVVYYAVSDKAGNVTKQSRIFNADIESIRGRSDEYMTGADGYGVFENAGTSSGSEGFDTEGFSNGFNTEEFEDGEGFTEGEGSEGNEGAESSGAESAEGTSQEGNATGN